MRPKRHFKPPLGHSQEPKPDRRIRVKSKKQRKLLKLRTGSSEVLAYTGHKGAMTFDALNKENQKSSEEDIRPLSGDKDEKKATPPNLDKTYYKFRSLDEFENRMQK